MAVHRKPRNIPRRAQEAPRGDLKEPKGTHKEFQGARQLDYTLFYMYFLYLSLSVLYKNAKQSQNSCTYCGMMSNSFTYIYIL